MDATYAAIASGYDKPTLSKHAATLDRAEALFHAMRGTLRAIGDDRTVYLLEFLGETERTIRKDWVN